MPTNQPVEILQEGRLIDEMSISALLAENPCIGGS